MSALGNAFRAKRESQGLTLSDVAERIHIRRVYLEAIEAENWSAIGQPVYVRGFLRNYARCLGLDADAAVAQFESCRSGAPPSPAPVPTPERAFSQRPETRVVEREDAPRRGLSLGAIAGMAVALALVIFAGYQYIEYSRAESAPRDVRKAAPSPERSAQLERSGRGLSGTVPPRISAFGIRLRHSSWVRVVVDGKVELEGIYPADTQRTFSGRWATVRAGNAGGVEISVDGRDLGPMGGSGDVAERSFQL
jgi:transcriptional regulator with XRE-family HTH domain